MDREAVADRVRRVIAAYFDIDPGSISDDATAGSFKGWDSASHVGLILSLEESLGIEFDIRKVGNLDNIGDLVQECAGLISRQQGARA